jgi:hypothetical protein
MEYSSKPMPPELVARKRACVDELTVSPRFVRKPEAIRTSHTRDSLNKYVVDPLNVVPQEIAGR